MHNPSRTQSSMCSDIQLTQKTMAFFSDRTKTQAQSVWTVKNQQLDTASNSAMEQSRGSRNFRSAQTPQQPRQTIQSRLTWRKRLYGSVSWRTSFDKSTPTRLQLSTVTVKVMLLCPKIRFTTMPSSISTFDITLFGNASFQGKSTSRRYLQLIMSQRKIGPIRVGHPGWFRTTDNGFLRIGFNSSDPGRFGLSNTSV